MTGREKKRKCQARRKMRTEATTVLSQEAEMQCDVMCGRDLF